MTDLPYESVGSYRLKSLAGRGGFATVYVAADDRLDDDVAIKLLADNHATDPDMRARFLAEGRTLRRIDHPDLIRVHDVGETDRGQPYLVLEYADRGDLASRVQHLRGAGWQPQADEVHMVAEAVLGAVGALHQNRLVHRDLKPDNLLLRSTSAGRQSASRLIGTGERLMVSDLGFAKDLALNSGLTAAGGTRTFSAPEQLAGGIVTDAADVYAAARVLQWLVGPPPPNGKTQSAWRNRLATALAPALSDMPDQRPSAEALLESVRQSLQIPVPPPVESDTSGIAQQIEQQNAQSRPATARPHRLWFMAVPLLLVAALGAVFLWPESSANKGSGGQVVVELPGDDLVVSGPISVEVGTEALISAVGPAGARLSWRLMPDGERFDGVDAIRATPQTPGLASVELVATLTDGQVVTSIFRFDVEVGDP